VIDVVVIDDSAFMRKALTIMMESDPEIQVVGTARDGMEGFQKVRELKPHVVTLDIEMPRTNGFECLKMIMDQEPTPVLIVSSLTTKGADTTLEAMDMGAVDFIPKTQSFVAIDITKIQPELIEKIKTVARKNGRRVSRVIRSRRKQPGDAPAKKTKFLDLSAANFSCISIGVSTGGPPVVSAILSGLSEDFPLPLVIAQHMPKEFTHSFSARLNQNSPLSVKEAETGDIVRKGHAFVARGGQHLFLRRKGFHVVCEVAREPEEYLYHPSVDLLISSSVDVYGSGILGIILTGMGKDGVIGLKQVKDRGGKVLAQNEESCVVYGMPRAAVVENLADAQLSVEGIIASLNTITS